VLTGCNEAFIINTEKRDEILANCQTDDERTRTAELIRPILRGRDIKRYAYEWAELWLIATFPSQHYNIDEYPAVKQYLLSFGIERLEQTGKTHIVNGEKVKARKRTSNKWFETQDSISYWEDFSKPKIIYPNMTKYMPFVYDNEMYLTNQKCFIITGMYVAYLTAFFNSSLFKYCFRDSFPELQGGTRELSKIFFDKIPVYEVSDVQNLQFQDAVEDIQKEYTKQKAQRIDSMLFDLYNLSSEERATIGFVEIV
jgi:putative type IIS restriction endonuclease